MSRPSHLKCAIIACSFAGVLGLPSVSKASPFHFGGGSHVGGGGHMSAPHFGGGSGARPSFAHFDGGSSFGRHPSGSRGTQGGDHWPTGRYPHPTSDRHPHPGGDHRPHPRSPRWPQVGSHCGHWGYRCGPRPIYPGYGGGDAPGYEGGGYNAPAPVRDEPSYTPAPTPAPVVNSSPKTCVPGGTYITVVFQPTVTAAAITAFLKEYDVVMADGPNADGMYRIKISPENGSPDQFGQMIDSMRSRKDVISSIET